MNMHEIIHHPPRIIDATLREGTQAPGVRFGEQESVEIARALVSLGVDMIECGHPLSSEVEARRVRSVVAASGSTPVLAHARARREDIDSVKAAGAQWVGIFVGINEISRRCRVRFERSKEEMIRESVRHAKDLGLQVRFTIEDGSRTSWRELAEGYSAALDTGADRICFADTVGLLCPWETEELVARICREFGGQERLEVHFHDDRGMANANALSAARAGAGWISASVNGIGERCGISDTVTLLANFHALQWRALCGNNILQSVSRLVQAHSRLKPDPWRPITGANAFTHVSKLHRRAAERDESAYSWIAPATLNRTSNTEPAILPLLRADLINNPEIISATELRHHRHGPGDRFVMLDDRVVPDARQYCIVRSIPEMDDYGPGHVDRHRHTVDSTFLFIGNGAGLAGLTVEVSLGDESFVVESPKSVFIPSGVAHSYRVLAGAGLFINYVLAGEYNSSLLDDADIPGIGTATTQRPTATAAETNGHIKPLRPEVLPSDATRRALDFLAAYIENRMPGTAITMSTHLLDVLDSLMFLDLFLFIEGAYGESVSLDEVAAYTTFGEVAEYLGTLQGKEMESECVVLRA